MRVRPVPRLRPLALIRALTAEDQLRTVDAVAGFGRRARAVLRVVPPGLRGSVDARSGEDPLVVLARALAARPEATS